MRDHRTPKQDRTAGLGRLRARPTATPPEHWAGRPGEPTEIGLGTGAGRGQTLLYVPQGYRPETPAPLILLLHGAGGHAEHGLRLLRDEADEAGLILLAPSSRQGTWDAIQGSFGPDVTQIDQALDWVFARLHVDPARVAIGGFSDGASYALSLGITNGDLFGHILALSPGFMVPDGQTGRLRVFLSHGTRDETLPIDSCSRRLAPALRHAGYDVEYQEFDGPHTVPPRIARRAADWFLEAYRKGKTP